MNLLDLSIVVLYLALMIWAIFLVRPAKRIYDFALGHRSFPATIAFATLASTAIGPGFTTGLMEKVATGGLIWVVIFCFFALQMLVTGLWLAPRLRSFAGTMTLGDVMGARYGVLAKILTGLVTVLFSIGIVGAIAKATGTFIHVLMGIDQTTAIVVSSLVVIAYATIGGLKADVLTDVMQFVILAFGVPLVLLAELAQLPDPSSLSVALTFNPSGMSLATFVGLAASFFFGEFLLPPYAVRAMSARTPSAARAAFVLTAAFSAIWFLCIGVIGAFSSVILPGTPPENLFMTVVRDRLPTGLTGLVVAALIAIIASSQDSFLNSASVAFTRDIMAPLRRGKSQPLAVTKTVCVLGGLLGMFLALYLPTIVDALLLAYSVWAPAIVVPLVTALLFPGVRPAAGVFGMVAGCSVTLLWSSVLGGPFGLPALLPGMAASFLGTVIGAFVRHPGGHPLLLPCSVESEEGTDSLVPGLSVKDKLP